MYSTVLYCVLFCNILLVMCTIQMKICTLYVFTLPCVLHADGIPSALSSNIVSLALFHLHAVVMYNYSFGCQIFKFCRLIAIQIQNHTTGTFPDALNSQSLNALS